MRGSAVRVPSPAPGAVPSGAGGTLRGGKRSGRGAGSSRGQGGSVPAARTLRTHFLWDGGCLSLLPAAAGCFGRRLRACRASTAERRTTGAGVRVAAQPPAPAPHIPPRYLCASSSSRTLPPVPSRCASAERGRAASRSAALPGVGRAGRREKREAGKGRAGTEPEPGCGPEVLSGTQALLQGSRGGVGAEVLREHRTQMGQVLFSQPAGFQSWAGSQRAQGRACCTRAPHHPAFSSLQGPLVYLSHMSVWAVYVRKSAIHKLAGR